jgi:hypothetical protein
MVKEKWVSLLFTRWLYIYLLWCLSYDTYIELGGFETNEFIEFQILISIKNDTTQEM